MNWYSVFYWLTISDGVKKFFDVTSNTFTAFAILAFIVYFFALIAKSITISDKKITNQEDENVNPDVRSAELIKKHSFNLFKIFLVCMFITWFGYVFTPSKKDCMLIVAGGAVGNFIQSDTTAKQIPSDITKFLHLSLKEEINKLSNDAKKEVLKSSDNDIDKNKEEYLEKLKKLTKDELIQTLLNDSTKH